MVFTSSENLGDAGFGEFLGDQGGGGEFAVRVGCAFLVVFKILKEFPFRRIGRSLHGGAVVVFISIQRALGGAVEKGEEVVVFVVKDGIVFMRVTACAGEGHAHHHSAEGLGAVEIILGLEFGGDGSSLRGGGIHADEAGGDFLTDGRVRQEVAGELPGDEVIEREVVIEGADDPVAVGENAAPVVEVESVGVAVADGVEPVTGLMFAIGGRGEEGVDVLGVSLGRLICEE